MKETYIVSGFMRSGTSMMMRALIAGGLVPAYNKNIDIELKETEANPNGFYELSMEEYLDPTFPKAYEGKVIKCLWKGALELIEGNYKMVFMVRDPEEIRKSFENRFIGDLPLYLDNYREKIGETIEALNASYDIDLVVFNYWRVIEDPLSAFNKLKARGWPIDVKKCISVIEPRTRT